MENLMHKKINYIQKVKDISLPIIKNDSIIKKIAKAATVAFLTAAVFFGAGTAINSTKEKVELPSIELYEDNLKYLDTYDRYSSVVNTYLHKDDGSLVVSRITPNKNEPIKLFFIENFGKDETIVKETMQNAIDEYNYIFEKINPQIKFVFEENPTLADISNPNNIRIKYSNVIKEVFDDDMLAYEQSLNLGDDVYYPTISLKRSTIKEAKKNNTRNSFETTVQHEIFHALGFGDYYILFRDLKDNRLINTAINSLFKNNVIQSQTKPMDDNKKLYDIPTIMNGARELQENDIKLLCAAYGDYSEDYEKQIEKYKNFAENYYKNYSNYLDYTKQIDNIIEGLNKENIENLVNNLSSITKRSYFLDVEYINTDFSSGIVFEDLSVNDHSYITSEKDAWKFCEIESILEFKIVSISNEQQKNYEFALKPTSKTPFTLDEYSVGRKEYNNNTIYQRNGNAYLLVQINDITLLGVSLTSDQIEAYNIIDKQKIDECISEVREQIVALNQIDNNSKNVVISKVENFVKDYLTNLSVTNPESRLQKIDLKEIEGKVFELSSTNRKLSMDCFIIKNDKLFCFDLRSNFITKYDYIANDNIIMFSNCAIVKVDNKYIICCFGLNFNKDTINNYFQNNLSNSDCKINFYNSFELTDTTAEQFQNKVLAVSNQILR